MSASPPALGTRIALHNNPGTVRYAGTVIDTTGTWLGVEWDDTSRGKHDGERNGTRYFHCRVPGSGSFIRSSAAGLSYGTTFIDALEAKYVDEAPAGQGKETVVLGSSNGMIEVEAVGLDKVRSRLARLDRLRDASLDGENVASAGQEGDIKQRCPNIRHLDLSQNLLPSWDMVALIARQLECLETLALNQNRFADLHEASGFQGAFRTVKELQLNDTLLSWDQVLLLEPSLPSLQHLQLGYNRISQWHRERTPDRKEKIFSNLETLNLEGNAVSDWQATMHALNDLPCLQRLVLSKNQISSISLPSTSQTFLPSLRYLSLSDNAISSWSSLDALNACLPHLAGLNMVGNPFIDGTDEGTHARLFIIARLASLTVLNGTPITAAERRDAERFYLSQIVKAAPTSTEEQRRQDHPRWQALSALHGAPDAPTEKATRPDVLGSHLIDIGVCQLPSPPSPTSNIPAGAAAMRVLPSMPLKALRIKTLKTLGIGVRKPVRMYVMSKGELGHVVEEMDGDSTEIGTWGLENGCTVAVVLIG